MEDGDVSTISITRPDKGVSWNLMPDDRMYMEIPISGMDAGGLENTDELESRAKVKVLGPWSRRLPTGQMKEEPLTGGWNW
jgi:hypothetical protein